MTNFTLPPWRELLKLPQLLEFWQQFPKRYFIFASMPAAWLIVIPLKRYLEGYHNILSPSMVEVIIYPATFFLLVRLLEGDRPFKPVITFFPAVSLIFFSIAPRGGPGVRVNYEPVYLWLAVVTSCLAFLPLGDFLSRLRRNPHAGLIAFFAVSIPLLYTRLLEQFWVALCTLTAKIIYYTLSLLQADINLTIRPKSILLHSDHYRLNIYQPCSGLEGIFLFHFLLSIMLLADWKLFGTRRLWTLYVAGALYMFAFNSLRIMMLYLLANWAWHPNASPLAVSMRGTPLEIFHTFIGWTLYLIAFFIFATFLYRSINAEERA